MRPVFLCWASNYYAPRLDRHRTLCRRLAPIVSRASQPSHTPSPQHGAVQPFLDIHCSAEVGPCARAPSSGCPEAGCDEADTALPPCIRHALDGNGFVEADWDGILDWIAEAAARAPHNGRKRAALCQLLTTLTPRDPASHCREWRPPLHDTLRAKLRELQQPPKDLPADEVAVKLPPRLRPRPALKASQGSPGVLPALVMVPGVRAGSGGWVCQGLERWDFADPVKMHERVYLHVLGLVAEAVQRGFHAAVHAIAWRLFGEGFDGVRPAPRKTYARMLSRLGADERQRAAAERPRAAANADVVRCAVAVPRARDVVPFLDAVVDALGPLLEIRDTPDSGSAEPEPGHGPWGVVVHVVYRDSRTFGELWHDPEVRSLWEAYAQTPAHREGESTARRARHVAQALAWLCSEAVAPELVRLVCEIQVGPARTAAVRARGQELRRLLRAPSAAALLHDYGCAPAPAVEGALDAARHGDAAHAGLRTGTRDAVLLLAAAEAGHADVVDVLLANAADVDAANAAGVSALMRASGRGHCDVVRLLLSKGAAVDARSAEGNTALMGAALQGRCGIAEMLLSKGADLQRGNRRGLNALSVAVAAGHSDVAALLLARGADPEKGRFEGTSALMCAAALGRCDAAALLLAHGADSGRRRADGLNAFRLAYALGHEDVLDLLLLKRIQTGCGGGRADQ